MPAADALLDSNVVVAAVSPLARDHAVSVGLFVDGSADRFAIAAHSLVEAFVTLTKRGGGTPFGWPPNDAIVALESVASATLQVALTPAQTLDALRRYAATGGIGPRVYDRLIGEAAVRNGIRRIVTWNISHMRSLFPTLDVLTPEDFQAAARP